MQHKANGDSQKTSEEEISDRVQKPQDERKAVQKRTFTRWMNVFLQRCDPPVEVHDLFTDIQDGRVLMALLEELSGCKLLYRFRSSSHRIFRLNNISKALAFLDDRHVKLLGIDAPGIADGIPSVVLSLIWNIILYFQVKKVTGGLQRHFSSSLSSLSASSYPSPSDLTPQLDDYSCNTLPSKGRKAAKEYHGKAIKTLLQWVQRCTSKFGVEVHDFGKSWRSGLVFLAMVKSINPSLVDLRESLSREPRENAQLAFVIAQHSLDIPPLLDPEDVTCTSPDEQSIITYVSLFLGHCLGIDEDCVTDAELPDIPNFGSLESVSLGETLADDPKAQALLKDFEKSSEQLLWKRWSRTPSGRHRATSLHTNGAATPELSHSCGDIFASCRSQSFTEQPAGSAAASAFSKKKSRSRSVLQPPSPLDAGVVSQEIRSWMEKGSDHDLSKPRAEESHFSLSSEEGIYSLSALDSDEEDAYSYILDLNKEVFQPYSQLKRQVPRVEEETAEEIFLHGQQKEESKPLEVYETINGGGCKHREGSFVQNTESEVRAQSVIHRKFDFDKNESSSRETAKSSAVFDMKPEEEGRSRGKHEDGTIFRGQSKVDGNYHDEKGKMENTENVRLLTRGCDKTESLIDESKKTKLFEMADWKKEPEGQLFEKCGRVSEKRVEEKEDEEESLTTHVEGQNGKLEKEKEAEDRAKEKDRENQQSIMKVESFKTGGNEKILTHDEIRETKLHDNQATSADLLDESTPQNGTNGGVKVHGGENGQIPACSVTSKSSRDGGLSLQSLAASCDVTTSELEMLLALWILLYCCFILHQMYL